MRSAVMVRCGMLIGARHMTARVKLWAAHIDQHEVEVALERFMDVAAVGLDAEAPLEMRKGGRGVGKAGFGDEAGHGVLLRLGSFCQH